MTTTNSPKLWTVNTITAANFAAGYHWFKPGTMRSFGTRVLPEVYQGPGGVYFVTCDKQYDGTRAYSVRQFNPAEGTVSTFGKLGDYTKAGAIRAAKEAAIKMPGTGLLVAPEDGGVPYDMRGLKVTTETHKPISVLAEFAADLRTHGNPACDDARLCKLAAELIAYAGLHHKAMERDCNKGDQFDHEGNPKPYLLELQSKAIHTARECGAVGVLFSGDPRGCTLKLTFADGHTNDFGREGYCVPTSLKCDD